MSHFAAGIIWRMNGPVREYLIIRYYRNEKDYRNGTNAQVKFAGGTNNDFPEELLYHTLHREVVSETGLQMPSLALRIWVSDPIPGQDGDVHVKHFFTAAFEECKGTLRAEVMNDNGDWLAPPEWMSEEELDRVIFRSHRPAFEFTRTRLNR
jgi:hypothetical protein